jgi:hypothetical protein
MKVECGDEGEEVGANGTSERGPSLDGYRCRAGHLHGLIPSGIGTNAPQPCRVMPSPKQYKYKARKAT